MDSQTGRIFALLAIGLGLFLAYKSPSGPNVPDAGVYPTPSAEMQTMVIPLKSYNGKKNADLVAKFYWDFGDVLSRDTGVVQTVGQFKTAHERAQVLMAQGTDIVGSLPGLSAMIDAALVQALGKEDVAINKPRAVEILKAIAWSLGS